MRIYFLPAHVHLVLACACVPHLVLRMRISFWPARAHLFLACASAPHLELRMRIAFWLAHGLRIFICARASHFDLHMRTSFTPARAQLILSFAFAFVLPAHELFFLCMCISFRPSRWLSDFRSLINF